MAAQTFESIRAGIDRSNGLFASRYGAKDIEGLGALYDENACLMAANFPNVEGRDAIKACISGFFALAQKAKNVTEEVIPFGDAANADMAYEKGQIILLKDDDTTVDHGRYIIIWKRVGDEWRIYRDIFSSFGPEWIKAHTNAASSAAAPADKQ